MAEINNIIIKTDLLNGLSRLVKNNQQQSVDQSNKILTLIFRQTVKSILQNERAKYGKSVTGKNMRRMLSFTEQFRYKKIIVKLLRQLSWSHFREFANT